MRKLICALGLLGLAVSTAAFGQTSKDWITGLPREAIHVKSWPGGKKVAVCFVLYVEVWVATTDPISGPT